jgi:N-acetylglucosaminyldiphosphoundecaprenol N-acetyl-beta-D-mannosaminyltransferase
MDHNAAGPSFAANDHGSTRSVTIGPFTLPDLSPDEVLERATQLASNPARGALIFAVHASALNERSDADYLASLREADLVYADGISVVALARLAGARRIRRVVTTDLAPMLLDELAIRNGTPPRVMLVGGPPGLAASAGDTLAARTAAEVVCALDGYGGLDSVASMVRTHRPDLAFVGLGAPLEATWATSHRHLFGRTTVVTCGGWFKLLAGIEKRPPALMQKTGLEWLGRLAQNPHRLAGRYLRAGAAMAVLASHVVQSPRR